METHVPVNGLQVSEHAAERYARPPPPIPAVGVHRPTYNPVAPPRPPTRPDRVLHTRTFVQRHRDPPGIPVDQVIPAPTRDHGPYRGIGINPHSRFDTHAQIPGPPLNRGEPASLRGVGGLNTPVPQQKDLVTLAAMRKHRARNEYTDTPSRSVLVQNNNNHNKISSRTSGLDTSLSPEPIINQPGSSGLKKEPAEQVDFSTPCQESIICAQCGKCRCGVCMQQRPLPSKWICHGKCECSAQKCVEYCTCMWIVKALFYHSFKDSEADEEFKLDEPCACCDQPHCCKRWTCMGLMSLCLPCLCLYLPSHCCLVLCTSCYNHGRGCRCRKDRVPGSKGLLLDSESSSA